MDDRFDEALREAARDYNRPPETPRDLMWARIEAIRRERAQRRQRMRTLAPTWLRWGVGIAATLVIGFAIGRLSEEQGPETRVVREERPGPTEMTPAAGTDSPASLAYRLVTAEHLGRAEVVLTSFRVDPYIGITEQEYITSVRHLLSSTRLLLASPAASDPAVRELLEDLELILLQISQLSPDESTEVEIIDEGLESKGLLPRLRSAILAGVFEVGA